MTKEINTRLLINGGWPAHGEIYLSGDTYSAIVNFCIASLQGGEVTIFNCPRSQLFLTVLDFANDIGIKINWKNIDTIVINTDWSEISGDIVSQNVFESDIYEMFLCLLLVKKFSANVSLSFRKRLIRFKRLGFEIEYSDENFYKVVVPIEFKDVIFNIYGRKRDFFTTLCYSILKNLCKGININFDNNYSPILNLLEFNSREIKELVCDANKTELNFYASLGLLTDGEITIRNADLSKSLSFLLDLREIGLEYEVKHRQVRIWQDLKYQKEFYNYTSSEPDEFGYLLLIHSVYGEKPVKIIGLDSYLHLQCIKQLNMLGCKIDFNTNDGKIYAVVSPGILKSSKCFLESNGLAGVILVAGFTYVGNMIVNNNQQIDHYLPDLLENLDNLKLKFTGQ